MSKNRKSKSRVRFTRGKNIIKSRERKNSILLKENKWNDSFESNKQ